MKPMQLDQFLSRFDIHLSKKVYRYCQKGIEIMKQSPDPCHALAHVERMLGYFATFLRYKHTTINIPVLLVAIIHHDIWRSQHFIPSLINTLLLNQLESKHAAAWIRADLQKHRFPTRFIEKVVYCVQKHAEPKHAKRETVEAKLLYDFDSMDMFSFNRIKEYIAYLEQTELPHTLIVIYQAFTGLVRHIPPQTYYFTENKTLAFTIYKRTKALYAQS